MTPTRYADALARIEELQSRNRFVGNMFTDFIDPEKAYLLATLKAVLEFHGPENVVDYRSDNFERADYPQCAECREGVFPCPTAEKIIEGVLGK